MKCISMWQPWATWVLWGWKAIETRTHNRFSNLVGQQIAIHAANHYDPNAIDLARPYLSDWQLDYHFQFGKAWAFGAVICTARVIGVSPRVLNGRHERFALIECTTPRYGLRLHNVKAIAPPIPWKGRQGIFTVEL